MDLYSLFTNIRSAELIFNLAIQIIIVSILGWAGMRLWNPRSAPVRSAGYLAILISLAILPVLTIMFNPDRITWFQSTIELHPPNTQQYEEPFSQPTQSPEKISVNDNIQPKISNVRLVSCIA